MSIACIIENHRVLSPIVGYITHRDGVICDQKSGPCVVATVCRLSSHVGIDIPARMGRYFADVPNGTYVDVGTQIGHIEAFQGDNCAHSAPPNEDNPAPRADRAITAPVAGFLVYTSPSGTPYCQKGEIITAGKTIAAVEFMKLRVEITYDSEENARFAGYAQDSSTRIEQGGIVARVQPLETS